MPVTTLLIGQTQQKFIPVIFIRPRFSKACCKSSSWADCTLGFLEQWPRGPAFPSSPQPMQYLRGVGTAANGLVLKSTGCSPRGQEFDTSTHMAAHCGLWLVPGTLHSLGTQGNHFLIKSPAVFHYLSYTALVFSPSFPRLTIFSFLSPPCGEQLAFNCGTSAVSSCHISNWVSPTGGGGLFCPFEDRPPHHCT